MHDRISRRSTGFDRILSRDDTLGKDGKEKGIVWVFLDQDFCRHCPEINNSMAGYNLNVPNLNVPPVSYSSKPTVQGISE